MNCQEALDLLYDIIDKEATQIDTQEVNKHLQNCRDCFKKFEMEESIQALINEKLKSSKDKVSVEKLESLKGNILDKLDVIDKEQISGCSGDHKNGFFRLPAKIMLAAASLAIFLGLAFFSADYYRHYKAYVPLEDSHLAVAENFDNFMLTASTDGVDEFMLQPINGYAFAGAVNVQLCDCQMQHAVYKNGDDMISVFIVSADSYKIPDDVKQYEIIEGGTIYYDHNCAPCHLVFKQIDDKIYITASKKNNFEVLKSFPQIASI